MGRPAIPLGINSHEKVEVRQVGRGTGQSRLELKRAGGIAASTNQHANLWNAELDRRDPQQALYLFFPL